MHRHNTATVYLVGAGPGDPDLLTVKALRLIQQADIIVYDRLVSEEILQLIPRGVQRIYVGKSAGHHALPQDEINQLLVQLASSHKQKPRQIVRLKGGDPFIFGRGSEEALTLKNAQISFEVIPGITAAQGCTSYSGIPLTHRGMARKFQVITGHFKENEGWSIDADSLVAPDQTLVFYMGLSQVDTIEQQLLSAGKDPETLVAIIENGTSAKHQTTRTVLKSLVQTVKEYNIQAPALIVIGPTVALADDLDWFIPKTAEEEISRYA